MKQASQTEYLGDKRELQAILETATNAALATGNAIFYDILKRHNVKGQLLEAIKEEKQGHSHTNGDCGGGGVTE